MLERNSLTARQQTWFAAIQDGLTRESGRTLAEWAVLARSCPETAHRRRLAWLKAEYGLGLNRASLVLGAAFPPAASWATPDALADALWRDAAARAIHDAVHAAATGLPDVVVGQRKGFTAFSRKFQFAAVKPVRDGAVLGLAVTPEFAAGLEMAAKDGWSERLLSRVELRDPESLTPDIAKALQAAWERS